MNLQNQAIQVLSNTLRAITSESVIYRRGNDTIDGLVATRARTSPEDYAADADIAATTLDQDWIVWAGDLAFAGQRTLPKKGDRIDWTDLTGLLHTYLVTPRVGGRSYRDDPTKQQLRIFTSEKQANAE